MGSRDQFNANVASAAKWSKTKIADQEAKFSVKKLQKKLYGFIGVDYLGSDAGYYAKQILVFILTSSIMILTNKFLATLSALYVVSPLGYAIVLGITVMLGLYLTYTYCLKPLYEELKERREGFRKHKEILSTLELGRLELANESKKRHDRISNMENIEILNDMSNIAYVEKLNATIRQENFEGYPQDLKDKLEKMRGSRTPRYEQILSSAQPVIEGSNVNRYNSLMQLYYMSQGKLVYSDYIKTYMRKYGYKRELHYYSLALRLRWGIENKNLEAIVASVVYNGDSNNIEHLQLAYAALFNPSQFDSVIKKAPPRVKKIEGADDIAEYRACILQNLDKMLTSNVEGVSELAENAGKGLMNDVTAMRIIDFGRRSKLKHRNSTSVPPTPSKKFESSKTGTQSHQKQGTQSEYKLDNSPKHDN